MQQNSTRLLAVLVSLGALGLAGCGCSHQPDRHPVVIKLEGFEDRPAIDVHIIARNAAESPRWENYSMSAYWRPGDLTRENSSDDRYEMHFGADKPPTQAFSPKSDPKAWQRLWAKWEGEHATKLFILAFLPGPLEDRPGSLDPRRRVLPLDRCRWNAKEQTIRCVLRADSIVVSTPPK